MRNKYFIFFFVFLLSSCTGSTNISDPTLTPEETFKLLMQECIDHSFGSVPGVSMSINSPLLRQSYSASVGYADKELNTELSNSHQFRIASVSKTFVAASILRLHEMDSLSIEDPISKYLDPSLISILKTDEYHPDKILIKHCLNHTSGLYDYAMGGKDFIEQIIKDPSKQWTRQDQVKAAIDWGEKLGPPGKQTAYSDTGYILLGAIIEYFFNGDLASGMRHLLKFEELGLKNTWLETLEEPSTSKIKMVKRYYGVHETTDWDASIDLYGGGGLISTTSDLAVFFYAIFNAGIYENNQTLQLMLSLPEWNLSNANAKSKIEHYNYGLWTIKVYDEVVYIHNGIWGTSTLYIPSLKSSIAVNTTRGKADRLIKKTISVLKQLKENE